MKRSIIVMGCILLFLGAAQVRAADISAGVSIDEDGLSGFYLSIGEHYQVEEKQIVVIRKQNISDEEMPVVFFLAKRAGVEPGVIVKLRISGKSWMEITADFGLTAEIFYVPVSRDPGPPYGKAYGHFKNRERATWGEIWLTDTDIVNFVNLRFISEHYDYSTDEIIRMREKGADFVMINTEVKKNKGQAKKEAAKFAAEEKDKGKGNGKKKK